MGTVIHLSIIIADLGRFAHLGGTVARSESTLLIIEDHRLLPAQRVQFITDHVDIDEVTGIDVTVLTDITPDCPTGLHEWHVSKMTDSRIELHCGRCNTREAAPRLPWWTGAVLRAPRLPYACEQETIDHGMD